MGDPPTSNLRDAQAASRPYERTGANGRREETDEHSLASRTNVMPQLRCRVVRESRRETWFVVNETGDELATLPLELDMGRSISRVRCNGEVAEFSAGPDLLLVRPLRPLRAGAGTIVEIHFR